MLSDFEPGLRGFLPSEDPLQRLGEPFAPWEEAACELPKLLASGALHRRLRALPPFEVQALASEAELARAMLLLSFLGHAYVWGAAQMEPPSSLPAHLAVPWCAVAKQLGRPPVLSYASYALANWRRLDPHGPLALGNLALLQNFLGGLDEEWFVLVHLEIEAEAASGMAALPEARQAVSRRDGALLESALQRILESMQRMHATLCRMPEGCDPYIYYRRVRPYIHGWKDNPALPAGLIYEGVKEFGGKPQFFRGETGAQSSIIPALDAILDIRHKEDRLRHYLAEMRLYMPPAHRRFLDEQESGPGLRDFLRGEGAHLARCRELFNDCVLQLAEFRALHLKYAARYIQRQSRQGPNPTAVGTGGTPFMPYLTKHQKETQEQLL